MDTSPKEGEGLPIVVEFRSAPMSQICIARNLIMRSGGLELLFSNQRKHKLSLPSSDGKGHPTNMAYLVRYLCDNLMNDARRDMFVVDDTV